MWIKFISTAIIFLGTISGYSMQNDGNIKSVLDSLIRAKDQTSAQERLEKHLGSFGERSQLDSLVDYIYYVGKVEALNSNDKALSKVEEYCQSIIQARPSAFTLRILFLNKGKFFDHIGLNEKAIEANVKALQYSREMPENNGEYDGLILNNLCTLYWRKGEIPKAKQYALQARKSYASYPETSPERLYNINNTLGGAMWYESKLDSALYYYNKAEAWLSKLETTPKNKYYRKATLLNNIAGLHYLSGARDNAWKNTEMAVGLLRRYVNEPISEEELSDGNQFLFMCLDNYGALLKELGSFEKAKTVMALSAVKKKKIFGQNHPNVAKAESLLGQINLSLLEFKDAETHLKKANAIFIPLKSNYDWVASNYGYLAEAYEGLNETDLAKIYYDKADSLYNLKYNDIFDQIRLELNHKAALFFAGQGMGERALKLALEADVYLKKQDSILQNSIPRFRGLLNLGEISYGGKNFDQAIYYAKKAKAYLNSIIEKSTSESDKIFLEALLPKVTTLEIRSVLDDNPNTGKALLEQQLEKMDQAIKILDKKLPLLNSNHSKSLFLYNNDDLFELGKTIALKLYKKTRSPKYLSELLSLHESKMYYKLRTRLFLKEIVVGQIPEAVLHKEKMILDKLNDPKKSLQIDSTIVAEKAWKSFLKTLRTDYPKYYDLKYTVLKQNPMALQNIVPKGTTLVRYLYIDDTLHVVVASETEKNIHAIDFDGAKEKIYALKKGGDKAKIFADSYFLYQALWKPLEEKITTEKIIIFPDRELFNLSFEMLTPKKIDTFDEFASQSLLAKHDISYNYSLSLPGDGQKPRFFEKDFVAYAPEFNSDMKQNYELAITDSVGLDKTYLTLLPQPFSYDLAQKKGKHFNGDAYLNEKASKQLFSQNAKEHKIIHIGTHAESNNISPELSRLVFAKNVSDTTSINDNYLYTYEIYNQDLSSNLTVLTACETGKPSYQPGEGMISLAHAFNYAGSESILTSLWQIDEQSSAQILEYFYEYLEEGKRKDEALRLAKLDYLKVAKGRTLHPQYWAGLVLMGDNSPIEITQATPIFVWLIPISIVLLFIIWIFSKGKLNLLSKRNSII